MAEEQIEESGGESFKLQTLRPQVQVLCEDFNAQADRPLADREGLVKIFEVLEQIKDKIADDGKGGVDNDDKLLPRSKRKELHHLLPRIKGEFRKRKEQVQKPDDAAAASDNGPIDKVLQSSAAAVTGCYPCMPRAAPSQQQHQKEEEEGQEEVSLKLLHRLAQNVLLPEQYYEWTNSYVDEERIYGWQEEADTVAASLVAGEGEKRMFRAAGIAGIHGSGKTALAQKVFVHDLAKDNFAIRLWVCVGPPDSEDRFNLLYRMLDNLGLDTAKVEDDIVANANVVKQATNSEEERVKGDPDAVKELRKAAKTVADRQNQQKEEAGGEKKNQPAETVKKPDDEVDAPKAPKEEAGAGDEDAAKKAKEEERIFKQLLKKKVDKSDAVQKSKIGVLLYILHVTLSKTSYLIVFDDIRAYDGEDGWYSNLTLPPPPEGEWGERLAYGLPKGAEHRGAVLVTCRKEDDAKIMVRTGRVFHPPRLEGEHAWKLFRREYDQAKQDAAGKEKQDDRLLEDLEQMRTEIVKKCLGLPVAIIEAARGFAALDPLPDDGPHPAAAKDETNKTTVRSSSSSSTPPPRPSDSKRQDDKEAEGEGADEATAVGDD